jgi:hypothetical protein
VIKGTDRKRVLKLLQAIQDDWALTDQSDAHAHMVLVNESRGERKDFKPPKALVLQLEIEGLIKLDIKRSKSKEAEREFLEFFGEKQPVALVYCYKLTAEGKKFLVS